MRSQLIDADLTAYASAFVAEVAPAVDRHGGDVDPWDEVQALVQACVDVDGMYSDEELEAFLNAFGPRSRDPRLAHATPGSLRADGVFRTARTWLQQPSELFETLVLVDQRDGSDYSWRYHDAASMVAVCVFELDGYRSPAEVASLERWRTALLSRIHTAGIARRHRTPSRAGAVATTAEPATDSLEDLLSELDRLIGLEPVKHQVRQVSDLLAVQRLRSQRGLATPDTSHHLVFTGNPGTGKTTVARLLARIYCALGVVSKGHLVETDRAGLVAGFVGQTAQRVDEVVAEALGGVLLIDEAYGLVRGGEQDYGHEALDALVKRMEDHRADLVVIVAGYPDEMDDFLDANPGLRSRFGRVVHFPDYTDAELVAIFELLCRGGDYVADDEVRAALEVHLGQAERGRGFGNGRLSRLLFERGVMGHASRVARLSGPSDDELTRLAPADLGL